MLDVWSLPHHDLPLEKRAPEEVAKVFSRRRVSVDFNRKI